MPRRRNDREQSRVREPRQTWPLPVAAAATLVLVIMLAPLAAANGIGTGASAAAGSRAEVVKAGNSGPVLPGTDCPSFPADAVWNTPITGLPVDADSAKWLAAMDASTTDLHPTTARRATRRSPTGSRGRSSRRPRRSPRSSSSTPRRATRGRTRSRPAPRSREAKAPGATATPSWPTPPPACSTSCGTRTTAPPARRPAQVPSGNSPATASARRVGPPPTPPACRSFRCWSTTTRCSPGSWTTLSGSQPSAPRSHTLARPPPGGPGGRRLPTDGRPVPPRRRLQPSAHECSAFCQTVITTMKTYGLIVADNGSNWYFQGTMDTRWTYTQVDQLKQIPASAFVSGRRVVHAAQRQLGPGIPARHVQLHRPLRLINQ